MYSELSFINDENTLKKNATISAITGSSNPENTASLAFSTHDGTSLLERMRIDPFGRTGFGTTLPGATLEVSGTVKFAGSTTPVSGGVLTSDATGVATWRTPATITQAITAASGTAGYVAYFTSASTLASAPIYVSGTGVTTTIAVGVSAVTQGTGSFAAGFDVLAGNSSVAIGRAVYTVSHSVAIGSNANADGAYAVAIGHDASTYNSSAVGSVAIGNNVYSEGRGSVAIGDNSNADASGGVALGYNAYSYRGFAYGDNTVGYAANSVALGKDAQSYGYSSAAIGEGTFTYSLGQTTVGLYNTTDIGNISSWVSTDQLFVVGNGTSPTARSNALTILKNGNVGIGVSSPTSKLQVESTITSSTASSLYQTLSTLSLQPTGPVSGNRSNIYSVTTVPSSNTQYIEDIRGVFSYATAYGSGNIGAIYGGRLYGEYNGTVSASEVTGALNGAGAGAGTTLSLNGTHSIAINYGGNIVSMTGVYVETNGFSGSITNRVGVYLAPTIGSASGNDFGFYQAGTQKNFFAGSVGIGTTTATQKLSVNGNIYVSGTTTTCTLGNGSGGTSCSSDERLKTNITPIEDSLNKILNLRGVEFDWNQKSGRAGHHAIGVIAQDVEKQFPTAVIEDKATGYKQVDYAVLVAPIIQSIKEFYTYVTNQFKEQSREIASKADQTEVDRLKAENQMLKDYLCSKDPTAGFCQRK